MNEVVGTYQSSSVFAMESVYVTVIDTTTGEIIKTYKVPVSDYAVG